MDDKLDLILDRLTAMDRGLKAEIGSLKSEIGSLKSETQAISEKVDMTWRAIQELRDDKTELNELRKRIEILESKLAM
ncbi:hypothetical protein DesLBE_4696 [Desulfitobacterium sp. LBE]|uniref:hypothetical protein n=1 Tax=Desulfitobacterium TaxID=36853 RepID=UPI00037E7478|nr:MULTISPECIES: hypothetical protein [Desulfitobacterium]TWH60267.1 hypothetical protein DesLBE_4696 [Desulfitobacterium sp. LBE]